MGMIQKFLTEGGMKKRLNIAKILFDGFTIIFAAGTLINSLIPNYA